MKTRAAILEEPGRPRPYALSRPLTIAEVELAPPARGEVLVRVTAAGLCHSDLSVINGDRPRPTPMALGHEAAGIVEELGEGVDDLVPGDHVVMVFVPSCGCCGPCAEGRPALCEPAARANGAGEMLAGGRRIARAGAAIHHHLGVSAFAERAVVSRRSLVKVPDDLPLETLCLLGCGVGTGLGSSTNAAGVRPGDHVMIVGVGGVGASAVQGASIAGAAVIVAVDPVAFKREMAQKLGATHAFASIAEATDFMRSVTDGQGADAAVLAMGSPTNTDVAEAFAAIGKGGTVVVTGMAAATEPMGIPVHLLELGGMQKTIRGALFGMCNPPADILRQIDLYRAGRLKLDEMVTRRYRLDDIGAAVDDLLEGRNIRGVVVHDT